VSFLKDCHEIYKYSDPDYVKNCDKIVLYSSASYLKFNICRGNEECVNILRKFKAPKGRYNNDLDNSYLMELLPLSAEDYP